MGKLSTSWFKNIKLIAWDLDGTLYPPFKDLTDQIDEARLLAITKHLQISRQEAKKLFAEKQQRLRSSTRVLDEIGVGGKDFFADFWHNFELSDHIDVDPQLRETFQQAQSTGGWQYALLTNANTHRSVKSKLTALGLSPAMFANIFASGMTGKHKPSPEAFYQLWEETPFKREEIIYVGDRESADIEPAKKLGLKTVRIVWQKEVPDSQADLISKTPVELLNLLVKSIK